MLHSCRAISISTHARPLIRHESRDHFSRKIHQTFTMRGLTTRGKNQRKCESTDKTFANAPHVFSHHGLSASYALNFPWISWNSSCRRISASSCTGLSSGWVSSTRRPPLLHTFSVECWINGQIDRSFIQNLQAFSGLHEVSGKKVRMNAVTARAKVENILEYDFLYLTHYIICHLDRRRKESIIDAFGASDPISTRSLFLKIRYRVDLWHFMDHVETIQLIHYWVVAEKSYRESEKPQPHEGFRLPQFVGTAIFAKPIASGNIVPKLQTKSFNLKTCLTRDST